MFLTIVIDTASAVAIAEVIGAAGVIMTAAFGFFKWLQKQKKQDVDIKEIKDELCILTYGLLACLKGMQEQGYNGPVKEATGKIEKHLNQKAHDQKCHKE